MNRRIVTIVLLVGLVFCGLALVPRLVSYHLPGDQQGYEPTQPIAFSHRLHAGELQISCSYCHSGAEKSRHAGIPAANVCMNCHKTVTAPYAQQQEENKRANEDKRPPRQLVSENLKPLYEALGLDEKMQPDPKKTPKAIAWVQVHKLPAFACFDHRFHMHAGLDCKQRHGPVETMERVRQVESLSMGWCVNCHRDMTKTGVSGKKVKASLDCAARHY